EGGAEPVLTVLRGPAQHPITTKDLHKIAYTPVTANRLPEPAFPTATQALAAYWDGGPAFSRFGWSATTE
ncbi:hypothetical protein ACIQIB_39200, partial [Kitasatospora sp. NPDC092286]